MMCQHRNAAHITLNRPAAAHFNRFNRPGGSGSGSNRGTRCPTARSQLTLAEDPPGCLPSTPQPKLPEVRRTTALEKREQRSRRLGWVGRRPSASPGSLFRSSHSAYGHVLPRPTALRASQMGGFPPVRFWRAIDGSGHHLPARSRPNPVAGKEICVSSKRSFAELPAIPAWGE